MTGNLHEKRSVRNTWHLLNNFHSQRQPMSDAIAHADEVRKTCAKTINGEEKDGR